MRSQGGTRRFRSRQGFTLLEMLVSLSILAAIAAFLVVAFRLTGHSLTRGEEEAAGMARLRAGTEILERGIRSAEPTPILPLEGSQVPYFRGETGRLRFLSTGAPSSLSGGGFRLVSFYGGELSRDARGLLLSVGSPMREAGVESWEGTDAPRVVLSDASEITFLYSPGPTEEGKWEWVEAWDSMEKKGLPAAVRVEFTTPSESGPLKTALVVPLPAGGS
jgi:general secretion pathway protein J